MKKLLLLAVLALLCAHALPSRAQSLSLVYCNVTIAAFCNPTVNPGTGAQGDLAWQAFGKINNNFSFIAPIWALGANQLVGSQGPGTFGPITIGANLALTGGVLSATGGGGGGVSQLLAGTNITLSPTNGLGTVTISASSTAATAWSAITTSSNTQCAPCTIGTGATFSAVGSGAINATAVPAAGITGLGTNVGTFLGTALPSNMATFLGTPTAANLGTAVTGASLVAGTNITITGAWPNQTINSSGGGGAVSLTAAGSNVVLSPSTITGTGTVGFSLTPTFTTVNGVTIPSVTGTADILNQSQTFTAFKTFLNGDIGIIGSGTGYTAFSSANATGTNFAITFPAANDTVALLAAAQTFTNKSIAASEVNSGTLAAARMPALTGDTVTSAGAVATTTNGSSTNWTHSSGSPTLSATNSRVIMDSGTGPYPLPTAVGEVHEYCVSVGPSNTSTVSITTTSSQTVQGAASPITISGAGNGACFRSDGSNWTY